MVDTITNDRTLKNPITETWKVLLTLCHAGERERFVHNFLPEQKQKQSLFLRHCLALDKIL